MWRGLCYDEHHVWMGTVVLPLPDRLPYVLRGDVGPVGKDNSSPALWRIIQRYGIGRRMCRSIRCSAVMKSIVPRGRDICGETSPLVRYDDSTGRKCLLPPSNQSPWEKSAC